MSDEGGTAAIEELWWLLDQTGHLSRRVTERRLTALGIAPEQLHALRVISERKEVTVGEVARVLGLERNSASQLVERLVLYRLVERERSTNDRRRVHVKLIQQGEERLRQAMPEVIALATHMVEGIAADDLAATLRVLRVLRDRAMDILTQDTGPRRGYSNVGSAQENLTSS